MGDDEQEASDLLRQGRYFDEARQWYNALYIAPISERSVFLALGLMALFVGLTSIWAMSSLLPLKDRPQIMLSNPRIDDTKPRVSRLRHGSMTINDAWRRFYLEQYVLTRESYLAVNFMRNVRFVTAHSDPAVAASYMAAMAADNPRNPVALLGAYGTRNVIVQSIATYPGNPQVAILKFSTETGGTAPPSKTQWTARIEFLYSDVEVSQGKDPETGKKMPIIKEPKFQVVKYEVTPS